MPNFRYTARDGAGHSSVGTAVAENRQALIQDLRRKGLTPTAIDEASATAAPAKARGKAAAVTAAPGVAAPKNKKVKPQDMVVFTRQLATIVNAGLPLMQGLDILAEQAEDQNFKLILRKICSDVEAGETFSDTLRKHPKAFPLLYVSMVKAGEASGNLDGILAQLAEYLEATEALKHKIKAAMTYPTVAFFLVMSIATFLIVWVVPRFSKIFESFDAKLPAPTLLLLNLSKALNDYFFVVVAVIAAAIFGVRMYMRTDAGRYQLDAMKLKLPIFGKLFRKVAISRFTRTFSTLTRSGVPILSALEIVENTAGNEVFARAIHTSQDSVRAGQTLAEPLAQSGVFPPMVTRMIGVGERTGALEALLLKISEFYDMEVETTVSQLTSLIEPLLIVVLGVIVGTIVIALFLPIFKLSSIVK